jgi:hypothetical protein
MAHHDASAIQDVLAALGGCGIARGDLVLVRGKGCQNFSLLALRDFGKIQTSSEFRRNLIEFCGRDAEITVGLLKPERRLAWFGGRELEGPAGNIADPKRAHELEAGQPAQVLGVPFAQVPVFGFLAHDGVPHDGVAEMIDHRRDGKNTAKPLVKTFLSCRLFGLRVRVVGPRHMATGAALRAPATTLRLVREFDIVRVIVASSIME